MPHQQYVNPATVGDYRSPDDYYKHARDVQHGGVVGVNWYGSHWQMQASLNLANHPRVPGYDMTAVSRQYQQYALRKSTAPPLLVDVIPAYALPNVALARGNYQPVAPNPSKAAKGITVLYRKVK